jgi:uncharacterized protein YuzE
MSRQADARYDPEADAIGIYFAPPGATYAESAEVAPGLILDYDLEGRVIGVEIQGVQRLLAKGSLLTEESVPLSDAQAAK